MTAVAPSETQNTSEVTLNLSATARALQDANNSGGVLCSFRSGKGILVEIPNRVFPSQQSIGQVQAWLQKKMKVNIFLCLTVCQDAFMPPPHLTLECLATLCEAARHGTADKRSSEKVSDDKMPLSFIVSTTTEAFQ